MRIDLIGTPHEIKKEWETLVKASETASFFQTFDWTTLWFKHFPCGEPCLLTLWEKKLVAIAPFLKNGDRLSFWGTGEVLGGELVTDFGDIITRQGEEEKVWTAILAHCRKEKKTLDLHFLREESPSFTFFKKHSGGKLKKEDVAPYLNLPPTWKDYLSSLEKKKRHELERKIRKLEQSGFFRVVSTSSLTQGVEDFFRLAKLSSDQKGHFLTPKMKNFFRDVVSLSHSQKMLDLSFLELEGRRVAATLSFIYRNEVLLYNSGFDPAYSYLAPGFLLKAFLVKRSIEEGRKRLDFLRGSEDYKYNLGGQDQNLYRVTL